MSDPAPPRTLVYGSVNSDEFFVVDHIVRTGETISSTSYSRRAGGKGANQAVAAARAGARVDFAGAVGADGDWLETELKNYGVDTQLLRRDEQSATGRAIIQLSSSTADNSIILFPGANFAGNRNRSFGLSRYSHLLVQNEIPWAETVSTLASAHAAGVVTFFNPSPMPTRSQLLELRWSDVDWLLINEGEAADLLATFDEKESGAVTELLSRLRHTLGGTTAVVMTLGEQGARAILPDGSLVAAPAGQVEGGVKDTTGAGDCFTGYLATLLTERAPTVAAFEHVLATACQAAAICVEKEGAMESVPTMAQVMQRRASSKSAVP
ncbi:hypothetical protein JCM10908_006953 [Rhodotorula pacifica]|uniref:putative ribokinase n=1 Tax=Rhodotorula pacifica TaxID=1495444 RepID=UPI003177F2D1